MKSIIRMRQQDRQEAGKVMGVNARSLEKIFAIQVKSYGHESEALALPVYPLFNSMVIDPQDPDYGKELFVPGISVPGDGSVVR